jgi:hypothetical protein
MNSLKQNPDSQDENQGFFVLKPSKINHAEYARVQSNFLLINFLIKVNQEAIIQ